MSNVQPSKSNGNIRKLLRRALKAILHHGGYKVLALLLALLLWAGLITQDPNLTRERTFSGVNVTVSGSDALRRNGFIVTSDLDELLDGVTLRAAVPQMQYQNAQASNYNARIDLSRITEPGEQSVRIITTSSNTYGTVQEVSPAEVQITVEEYITRYRIPVRVRAEGSAPDGFYSGTPTADPPMIAVSGPRSLVEPIICAEVTVALENLPAREGTNRIALPFSLLNDSGEAIESSLLEITSESVLLDSVVVEQRLSSLKVLELSTTGLLRGAPAEGYEIKSVSVTPDSVIVAGTADVLETLDAIYTENYIDLTGLSESINQRLRLRDPGNLTYTSASAVTVAVEIGPVIQSGTYNNIRLGVQNVGNGLDASLGTKYGSVIVSGPQLWLKKLRTADISLYCDAYGLPAGTYHLPLICAITGSDGQSYSVEVSPSTVEVTIIAK